MKFVGKRYVKRHYLEGGIGLKKRIVTYLKRMDGIIGEDTKDTDWDVVLEEHLVQVAFFQHERLIHLLVTILFVVIAFLTLIVMTIQFRIPVLLLFVAILVLLIPYINHYYLLENSVQKMYEQYDEVWKRAKKQR